MTTSRELFDGRAGGSVTSSPDGLSPPRPARGPARSRAGSDRGGQTAGAPRDPAPERQPHGLPRAAHRRALGRERAGLGTEDGADPRVAAAEGASGAAAAHARLATCSRWATTNSTFPCSSARSPKPDRRSRRTTPEGEELLAGALALSRGPALAEFAEPFGRHEAARLEELRLAAVELRIEAELALGHQRDVVGELETLIAQHPLRERLRSQHMLALYRSGRHAEALASYQTFRRTLAELGIEPPASLRELQRQMLQQDLPRATGEHGDALPRPRQQPESSARLPWARSPTRAAATSGSPTRSSATGRSTSFSSMAGSARSSPVGNTRSWRPFTGGSRRWVDSSSSTSAAPASPIEFPRSVCPTWKRVWTTFVRCWTRSARSGRSCWVSPKEERCRRSSPRPTPREPPPSS